MIRQIIFSDAEKLKKLNDEQLGYEVSLSFTQTKLKQLIQDANHHYFLVFEEKNTQEMIGYVHAEVYESTYAEPMFNVMALAVEKMYQRQGVASLLMKQLEQEAKLRGYAAIRLNSAEYRKEAHRFYERIGYKGDKLQKRFLKKL